MNWPVLLALGFGSADDAFVEGCSVDIIAGELTAFVVFFPVSGSLYRTPVNKRIVFT
jgi:hypothetical protein